MAKRFSGIIAPITTPFQNEEVMFDQFRENMKNTVRHVWLAFSFWEAMGKTRVLRRLKN